MSFLLRNIIKDAISDDPATFELATLQLADLLELSWRNITICGFANKLDYYGQHIPEELLKRPLSKAEQLEIIEALFAHLARYPNRGDLLWVVSKATGDLGLARLIEFVGNAGEQLETDTASMVIHALSCMISLHPSDNEKDELTSMAGFSATSKFVQRWMSAADTRLKEGARSLARTFTTYGIVL